MKLVTSNIEQFKIFFDVVYDVASETIELIFYHDRMTCAVLDRGRTRFFYVEYEMKFFDEFNVDERASICVSIEDMFKLLKLANKTDTLTLTFTDEKMIAELESPQGNKRFFEFAMPGDYVESPQFPNVDLPYHMEVDSSVMKQSVKDIGLVGDTDIFQFVLSEDSLTLMADTESDITSHSSVKYAQVIDNIEGNMDTLSVRFTLNYIKQMLNFDKISKMVSIDISSMALIYKFTDEIMGVTVNGMIAPRMMEDEE